MARAGDGQGGARGQRQVPSHQPAASLSPATSSLTKGPMSVCSQTQQQRQSGCPLAWGGQSRSPSGTHALLAATPWRRRCRDGQCPQLPHRGTGSERPRGPAPLPLSSGLRLLQCAWHCVATPTDSEAMSPCPRNGPQQAAISRPGQSLSLGLNPTAPAPPPLPAAHPTNQLSSLLTFRPVVKLSASTKGPLGV